mgnify:FL=1
MSYFNREFKVLSREQLERVHALTLDILRVKGVLFHSEVAREILAAHGAKVDGACVTIPGLLVDRCLSQCPAGLCGVPVIHKKAFIREKGRRMYSSCRIMARSMCRSATVNAVMGPCRM